MARNLFRNPGEALPVGLDQLSGKPIRLALIALYVIENNGIRHIAAVLRGNQIPVIEIYFKDWINNYFQQPLELEVRNLLQILRDHDINLVGMSVRASAYHGIAAQLTWRIRQELGIPVIWGGMHPTFVLDDCIPIADAVCAGEAEIPLLELVQSLQRGGDYRELQNFWFHTPAGVIRNPVRPLLEDIDSLPFRDFHSPGKFYINGRRVAVGDPYVHDPVFLMNASRGCPYSTCSYCSNSVLNEQYRCKGTYYRQRSIGSVMEELRYAKQTFPNLKRIRFDDEVFAFDREWTEQFARSYPAEIGLPFDCLLDPRSVTEWRLATYKKAGLDLLCIGVQNCERINRELYSRFISDEQLLHAAEIIKSLKIRVSYQIILDDPVSTSRDKHDFFEFLLRLPRPYDFYLFSITYYPQAKLTKRLLEEGKITAGQVEGKNTKVFEQFRVDLNYPRPPEDKFWACMIILLSKDFIPKQWLRRLSRNEMCKRHPLPLVMVAQTANLFKMGNLFLHMLVHGEVNFTLLRRWLNLRSLITT